MKKTILINAFGGSSWIGGLYYRRNIAFELLQNDRIRSRYNILVYCSEDNKHVFEDIKGIQLIISNSKGILQKIEKSFIYLTRRVICEFPHSRDKKVLGVTSISWIPDFQHKYLPELFEKDDIESRDNKYSNYEASPMPLILSSRDALKDFNKFYKKNKTNVYVVPFVSYIVPDVEAAKNNEERILSKFKLANSKYAVIMNQFWQHKNHIVVFQALEEYFKNNPESDFRFVFTGQMNDYRNPDYINSLKKIAENPIVAPHIDVLGFIDRPEQIALMKNAEYVIQPSLFEGWGTVVEDAKVLDKTILLSDIPIHREQKNEKCILFNPKDLHELRRLIEQESCKEHKGDIERGIADMYSRAKEYSKGFEQLLNDLELQA